MWIRACALADFIGCYFSDPPSAAADYTGDGAVDPDDLADYIGDFNAASDPLTQVSMRVGYAGYIYDETTGYWLARNRWYDPQTARWITRDPAGYADGLNVYLYVRGNPAGLVDPTGLMPPEKQDKLGEAWYNGIASKDPMCVGAAKVAVAVTAGLAVAPLAAPVDAAAGAAAVACGVETTTAGLMGWGVSSAATGTAIQGALIGAGLEKQFSGKQLVFDFALGVVGAGVGVVWSEAAQVVRSAQPVAVSAPGVAASIAPSPSSTPIQSAATVRNPSKPLLPGEGNVSTYGDLSKAGTRGDNITAHHVPSANHMAEHGVSKLDGIAINMEQPFRGAGGRHTRTLTFGSQAAKLLSPRQALGQGVWNLRHIYQADGLYGPAMRSSLQEIIKQNRSNFPGLFDK